MSGGLAERRTLIGRLTQADSHFVGGEFVPAQGEASYPVIDPSFGEQVATIPDATKADVDHAVASARHAFRDGEWSRVSRRDRGRMLVRLASAVASDAEQLAALEHIDTGKPLEFALADVAKAVEYLEYYAGWATKLEGFLPASSLPGHTAMVRPEARGVVAAIVPWNFPLRIAIWKLAPALAAGCSIVVKPAEDASLAIQRLGAALQEADLPAGAVDLVTGRGAGAGAALSAHHDVDMVTFTGSRAVGAMIAADSAGSNLKKAHLELGGKNANVVLADADLDKVAAVVVRSMIANAGQICTAGSRLLVEQSIEAEFVERISALATKVRLFRPDLGETQMGPLISKTQLDRVHALVTQSVRQGARITAGGSRDESARCAGGYFYRPTVVTGVDASMEISQEEIFGPVLTVETFTTIERALELANGTRYGLAAGVWTADLTRGLQLADRLDVGTVWVNTYYASDEAVPAGGFKESGNGREHGRSGLMEYVHDKTVWLGHD
jgi:aldehyde dehydrogenase (NAD+)